MIKHCDDLVRHQVHQQRRGVVEPAPFRPGAEKVWYLQKKGYVVLPSARPRESYLLAIALSHAGELQNPALENLEVPHLESSAYYDTLLAGEDPTPLSRSSALEMIADVGEGQKRGAVPRKEKRRRGKPGGRAKKRGSVAKRAKPKGGATAKKVLRKRGGGAASGLNVGKCLFARPFVWED